MIQKEILKEEIEIMSNKYMNYNNNLEIILKKKEEDNSKEKNNY